MLPQPLLNILRQIPLNRNLPLTIPARHLGNRTPRRKLFPQSFRHGLDVNVEGFQPRDAGHVFALVALDALYGDC